jgi:glucose/arabinose dehydrogenase
MIVSVGSSTNNSEESNERATVIEASPKGDWKRVLAGGLRAVRGMAFQPDSKRLWAVCDERDEIGDDLPPDFFTEVRRNYFYGWPYAYIGNNPDPISGSLSPESVAQSVIPDVLITAHSGVSGLVFYDGNQFPEEYKGDAFIALHGSWNRSLRTGYKIIRVRFFEGRVVGIPEDFLTGWMLGEDKREVFGMPSGLTIAKDGSLLISDDGGKRIWRLSYIKQ